MLLYFLLLVVIILLYYLNYKSILSNHFTLVLSLIILFLISSFRSSIIGADYHHYVDEFYHIDHYGSSYMEPGFVLLNRFILLISENYWWLGFAVNIFIFFPFYLLIKTHIPQDYWSFAVYIFMLNPYLYIQSTFNALRQGCAMGLITLAIIILVSNFKKTISIPLFLFLIIIASQFHKIAFVAIIIPIIMMVNWNKTVWKIVLLCAIVGNIIGSFPFIQYAIEQFGFSEGYITYEASMFNNPVYILFLAMFVMYLIYHYQDFEECNQYQKGFINLYLFSLCFLIVAVTNDMLYRVYIIFAFISLPAVMIVLANLSSDYVRIFLKHENKIVAAGYRCYYLFFYIGYILLLNHNNNAHYIPFQFCF